MPLTFTLNVLEHSLYKHIGYSTVTLITTLRHNDFIFDTLCHWN